MQRTQQKKINSLTKDFGYTSVVQHLPKMHEASNTTSNTNKNEAKDLGRNVQYTSFHVHECSLVTGEI